MKIPTDSGFDALTRREVLGGVLGGAAVLSASVPSRANAQPAGAWNAIVVGAGVFGAWTAWHLQRAGKKVLLVDAWGPAHARASSGGESRMTRTQYGADELYTRMAWQSLEDWRWLSGRAGLPIFHPTGVLYFFGALDADVASAIELHKRLKMPLETIDRAALIRRYPQIAWEGIEFGLFEPGLGALMARRSVQSLVREFVAAGGTYRQLAVLPPGEGNGPLQSVTTADGQTLVADQFIFACGAWLPKLFPDVVGRRIRATRQEVFFFAPEPGDARFGAERLPGWADASGEDYFYGFPDLEARGFKVARDRYGPVMDPDVGDRQASADVLADIRTFLRRRFPALASRPLSEARVCQYELSQNGDLLIDRHPHRENAWLVGAGSGHGFKHGPAVGRYAAALVTGRLHAKEARFSLASKKEQSLGP